MLKYLSYFNKDVKKPDIDLLELQKYISKKYTSNHNFLSNFKTPLDLGKYELALYLENNIQPIIKDTEKKTEQKYEDIRKILFIGYKINEFLEQPSIYSSLFDPPLKSELCNREADMKGVLDEALEYERENNRLARINEMKSSMSLEDENLEKEKSEKEKSEKEKSEKENSEKEDEDKFILVSYFERQAALSDEAAETKERALAKNIEGYARVELKKLIMAFETKFGISDAQKKSIGLPVHLPGAVRTGTLIWGMSIKNSDLHFIIYTLYERVMELKKLYENIPIRKEVRHF